MKRTSLEIPKAIQEKILTSPAKEGFLGAVNFFSDLTQYALGSDKFPHNPSVEGTISASHSSNAMRNLLLITRYAFTTRMTGFLRENDMGRPAIEVTVYYENKAVGAKFLAVFWHDGKVASIIPLIQWDTYTGGPILRHEGGSKFTLVD